MDGAYVVRALGRRRPRCICTLLLQPTHLTCIGVACILSWVGRKLLDAGADDSLCSTQQWYNMAVEYEAGMTALQIAQRDLEEHDMVESAVIVQMLESAAIGEWNREAFEAACKTDGVDGSVTG